MISTPSVVIGSGHQVKSTKVVPRLIIPCSCAMGSFVVEVGMKKVNRPADAVVEHATELTI
jgi:CheY-specific phosphatase CheX